MRGSHQPSIELFISSTDNLFQIEKTDVSSSSPWDDGLDTHNERKGTELDLDEEEEADEDSDSEDDVQIHIGEIKTTPLPTYTRPVKLAQAGNCQLCGCAPPRGKVMDVSFSAQIGGTAAAVLPRKVDLEAIPQIGGQSIFEYDIDADKPWRTPGTYVWGRLGTWR